MNEIEVKIWAVFGTAGRIKTLSLRFRLALGNPEIVKIIAILLNYALFLYSVVSSQKSWFTYYKKAVNVALNWTFLGQNKLKTPIELWVAPIDLVHCVTYVYWLCC